MPLFRTLTPRHRRFLAGLIVLSLAAVVCGVDFRQQQLRVNSLIAAITDAGGVVSLKAPLWRKYVASWRGHVVLNQETEVVLKGQAIDDEWLRDHNDLADLEVDWLMIEDCRLSAAGLNGLISKHPIAYFSVDSVKDCDAIAVLLTEKPTLWCASFDGTDLSDAGFQELPLEQLTVISVHGTCVTPTGLSQLKRCRRLGQLWIDGRQFDESVAELLRLRSQDLWLFLVGNDVTDAHLARLHGMRVRRVELTDTAVTSDGIATLKKSLPNCQVRVYSTAQTNQSKPPG